MRKDETPKWLIVLCGIGLLLVIALIRGIESGIIQMPQ